jgi:hypothetical protein
MLSAHDESPFEEPAEGATVAAFDIEPSGMHIAAAPLSAEMPRRPRRSKTKRTCLRPSSSKHRLLHPPRTSRIRSRWPTSERQGLVHEAQHIYENILARDPENDGVRAKLHALTQVNRRSSASSGG